MRAPTTFTVCCINSSRITIRPGRVLEATASGLLGLPECLGAFARLRTAVDGSAAESVLLDLRGVAFTLGIEESRAFARAVLAHPIARPVALVVSEVVRPFASAYAEVLTRHGLPRRAFLDPAHAADWLASVSTKAAS